MTEYQKWYRIFFEEYHAMPRERLEGIILYHQQKDELSIEERASLEAADDIVMAIMEREEWNITFQENGE